MQQNEFDEAANGARIVAGRLVGVARPASTPHLIVNFNGYANRAFAAPHLPFETYLEGRTKLLQQDAHVIWYAEDNSSWMLDHEEPILDKLTAYIVENGIEQVKILGVSAGGYAALRIGLLIDQRLAAAGRETAIRAYPINPQTGFRPQLIRSTRDEIFSSRWDKRHLGSNPILLEARYQKTYGDRLIDISELAATLVPHDFRAAVFFDRSNPIERVFSGDITSNELFVAMPQDLRLAHAKGCVAIWESDAFWATVNADMPFAEAEPRDVELKRLV